MLLVERLELKAIAVLIYSEIFSSGTWHRPGFNFLHSKYFVRESFSLLDVAEIFQLRTLL